MLDADQTTPNDQNEPAEGQTPAGSAPEGAAEAVAPARKTTRRRATKAAAPPAEAPADAGAADAPAAADASAASDAPGTGESAETTPAPVKRAPRKRVAKVAKAAAAPDAAAPDDAGTDAAASAADAVEPAPDVAAVLAPPARAPRKRAAKAAAPVAQPSPAPAAPAAAVDAGPIAIADDALAAAPAPDEAPAPAPRTRRRAVKAAAVPAATDTMEATVPTAATAAEPTAPTEAADVPGAAAAEAGEPSRPAPELEARAADAASPAEPAQPPAPRTRRRRATSAAAAPAPAERSEPSAGNEPAPITEADIATAESKVDETLASAEPPVQAPPARSRRRATRRTTAVAEVAAAVDEAVELVLDAEPGTQVDEPDVLQAELAIEDAEDAAAEAQSGAAAADAGAEPAADAATDAAEIADAVTDAAQTDAAQSDAEANAEADSADEADAAAEGDTDADAEGDTDADASSSVSSRRRRRGRRGRGSRSGREGAETDSPDAAAADGAASVDADAVADAAVDASADDDAEDPDDSEDSAEEASGSSTRRRRKRRRRGGSNGDGAADVTADDPAETVVHVREPAAARGRDTDDEVRGIRGSTRLEAKRQRRRDTRDTSRRRAPILTEAEFLARREAVERVMALRQRGDRTQIAVLEDGILVEHYVTRASATSYVGNIYLGRVQNVLPSMEAAFVDIGKGRNGVLYAGEVNWDAAGLAGRNRTIQDALSAGDPVLVQVTKDPIGHKGARLTSQISLPGRFLVYVPNGGMTGISRKLPDTERARLKAILKKIVPDDAGVIIRTAAEGASEEELTQDVERLKTLWESIQATVAKPKNAPIQVHAEPDLAIRVVRDVFNEDFSKLIVSGDPTREDDAWETVSRYVGSVAPELSERLERYTGTGDLFHDLRVDEQLAKALDRKVWLPSGGSLVIDRTEAMTVIDVNTGKFTGAGGNLEQTVTRNNIEAAEEIVRQLRLRDIGGMIVVDFIDMVLESNRDLVLRRLTECLGRDRTKHQVAEVTSLGLVQMTRKRVGEGLIEAFSEPCEHCHGRGVIVHSEPVSRRGGDSGGGNSGGNGGQNGSGGASDGGNGGEGGGRSKRRGRRGRTEEPAAEAVPVLPPEGQRKAAASVMALIAGAVPVADDDVLDADGADDAEPRGAGEISVEPVVHAGSGATGEITVEPVFAGEPAPGAAAPADTPSDAAPAAAPARPRRRRAASRPAGPPVLA